MYNNFQVIGTLLDYSNQTKDGLLKVRVRREFKDPSENEFKTDDFSFSFPVNLFGEDVLEQAKGKKVVLKGHLEPNNQLPRVDRIVIIDNLS